ncbi:BtrH N-terminal domain-containing protein [Alkaliphilus peptidifermentans]|uniref:Butirosin biosynthesis protein H, N-terminal n=1 Tax=Alkaliphilus peptidifermentans DSM 18978 TaxID=1120976 RepID=A0A1G5I4G3_9FIRM|nr:BtrH N-terminal domain-containing protein [Alkaliphilus peptidifermentans]SCY70985.1 Butirosin biosynthesis protein H, N-terminal [Alkaliphilus peptidifermentans DSM 18978]
MKHIKHIKHIIPQVKITKGVHCYYSSIFNIMDYNGIDLSEAELFMILGGFTIRYFSNFRRLDTTVHEEITTDFAKKLSTSINFIDGQDKSKAFEEIYESISNNNLVLLAIQNKYLDYNRVYQESEDYLHYILMYGYDIEAGLAYIADTFMLDHSGNALTYSGTMALDNIEKGIGAYACFNLRGKKLITKEDFFDQFITRFETFLKHQSDETDKSIYLGNQAIGKYIENIFPTEAMDKETFEKSCLDAIYNLKFGVMLHLMEYLIHILKKYSSMWNESEDLIYELRLLKLDWHKYFIYLLKVAYSGRREKAAETIKMGLEIFQYQERIFFLILNTASKQKGKE